MMIIFLKLINLLIVYCRLELILNIIITMIITKDGKNALMVAYIAQNMEKVLMKQIA